jgi:hypothetical protein
MPPDNTSPLDNLLQAARQLEDPLVRAWLLKLRRGQAACAEAPHRRPVPPDVHGQPAAGLGAGDTANEKKKGER